MALRILVVLLILAVPLELPGCGPFLPEAVFHLRSNPEDIPSFMHGALGIVPSSYERLYLVVAYRYLSGVGLNSAEAQAVLPPPHQSLADNAPPEQPNPWLKARNSLTGIAPINRIDPYRQVQKQGYYGEYLNCNDDAFRTAAATLERVRHTTGAKDWVAAQDAVFADCSQGAQIPPPASDPQLRADRAYQIASAKFYSEQYDAARQDYQTIAADASSPWHEIAPYLGARCLIRAGKLLEARKALEGVVADPAMARWHASANGLLAYVRTRLDPAGRMHQLALALVQPNSQATIAQDLTDYRMLYDQNMKPQPTDDLTDWIASFQSNGAGALEKWRVLHTLPWLVGALDSAGRNDSAMAELLPAAAAVPPDSPAFLTVSYQRVRLLPPDEARTLADRLLAGTLPTAARNQFLAERLSLARNFDEFLRYASRKPVGVMTFDLQPPTGEEDLDDDATGALNFDLPMADLKQAAASDLLPAHVRQELQHVIFVRTLLLSPAPPFDQVFTLLKSPGMQPDLEAGAGRNTPEVDKIDDYRDNWWCGADAPNMSGTEKPPRQPDAAFLPEADRRQAADEQKKLRAAPSGPDWLGAQTLAFAAQHPEDPRIPEALYLAVRVSRFGCTDAQTGDISKRAFDLLHRRFPNSDWAKKTPYWYK